MPLRDSENTAHKKITFSVFYLFILFIVIDGSNTVGEKCLYTFLWITIHILHHIMINHICYFEYSLTHSVNESSKWWKSQTLKRALTILPVKRTEKFHSSVLKWWRMAVWKTSQFVAFDRIVQNRHLLTFKQPINWLLPVTLESMTWTLNARLYKEWTEEFDEDETASGFFFFFWTSASFRLCFFFLSLPLVPPPFLIFCLGVKNCFQHISKLKPHLSLSALTRNWWGGKKDTFIPPPPQPRSLPGRQKQAARMTPLPLFLHLATNWGDFRLHSGHCEPHL